MMRLCTTIMVLLVAVAMAAGGVFAQQGGAGTAGARPPGFAPPPDSGPPPEGRPPRRPGARQPRVDKGPKVGDMAPTFSLMSLDGKQATDLEKFRGKRPVVLFFGSYS